MNWNGDTWLFMNGVLSIHRDPFFFKATTTYVKQLQGGFGGTPSEVINGVKYNPFPNTQRMVYLHLP